MSKTKPKREERATWFQRVRDWQESGLSKADYCRQYHISPGSFYHWCSQYRQDQSDEFGPTLPTPFIPVSLQPASLPGITIQCGDVSLSLPGSVQPEQLAPWVKALRAGVC